MDVIRWSSIPAGVPFVLLVIIAICGCVWFLANALNKFEKWQARRRVKVLVGATVGGKYICYPRGGQSEPVLLVSDKDHAAVRKSGKCELMVTVTCIGGFAFAEWVKPKFFDSVELGSKVVVTYTEDMKTHTKTCLSIVKKK